MSSVRARTLRAVFGMLLPGQQRRRKLLIMCDYYADPLWSANGRVGLDLDDYPLSARTKEELRAWARWYDALMDRDFSWPRGEARRFDAEGTRLWRRVIDELGPEYKVGFRPEGQRRTLWDDPASDARPI